MIGISDKQGEMLAFIETFTAKNGYPPTREEIRAGLNISTKSLVNYHLEALENASLLTRIPNTPRGIRLNSGPKNSSMLLSHARVTPTTPINQDDILELTYEMVTNGSQLYALKVLNETIVDAQAEAGDVVILQQQTHARNGELVAVELVGQGQTKLKRYYRENGHGRLEPTANNANTLQVKPHAVKIQGKVIAIIRQIN